jgi:peptidoglycan hydrolase-like protein with peptidoglycan-binding domain
MALPARVYVAGAVSVLLAGIGVNALVLQSERHPAPLFAPPPPRLAAPLPNPTPLPPPSPELSREASAAAQAPAAQVRPEPVAATPARASDQIGNLLRGGAQADDSHLILAAQNALVKLGYAVKPDGNDGAATHQALREFERAHGLPLSTEITPRLVKQLAAAARSGAH